MAVVDASIWVAYFHPQDKFHVEAVNVVKSLIQSGEPIRLPTLAFVEVAGAVSRATKSKALADKALMKMRDLNTEIWDLDDRVEPTASSIASQFACRGADACYVAVASLAQDALWTFDNLQKEIAAKVARVGNP